MSDVTSAVFIAALTSAFLHACWNILAKSFSAPRDILFGISMATATLCVVAFPFFGAPPPAAWPWIGAASVCNVLYLRLLTEAYARSPFGLVYAVVRSVVPPIIFILGWLFLTESGRPGALLGMLLVALSLAVFVGAKSRLCELDKSSLLLSGAAGLSLSLALLFDVKGIRASGTGLENLLRFGIGSSLTTAAAIALTRVATRADPFAVIRNNATLCYSGAVLLLLSYLCGMWAYAQGPIGLVAPLRESGILFGGILAVALLRERVNRLQWAAMVLATFGVILIRIG
jgi:drug/metabolite transporter (DMT)-like permease